jgi:hypothetical protein
LAIFAGFARDISLSFLVAAMPRWGKLFFLTCHLALA